MTHEPDQIEKTADWALKTPYCKAERRAERREEKLAGIPDDRRCPVCRKLVAKDSQWAFGQKIAVCRSCTRRKTGSGDLIADRTLRYSTVKTEWPLSSVSERAQAVGWSRSKQSKIETRAIDEVSYEDAERIREVFGVELPIKCSLWVVKNLDDVSPLTHSRLAELTGIPRSTIDRVATGKAKLSDEQFSRLVEVLKESRVHRRRRAL